MDEYTHTINIDLIGENLRYLMRYLYLASIYSHNCILCHIYNPYFTSCNAMQCMRLIHTHPSHSEARQEKARARVTHIFN